MGLALSIRSRRAFRRAREGGHAGFRIAIEAFLREVETRAFRIALLQCSRPRRSVGHRAGQHDSARPPLRATAEREWRPLFYRILQNRIRDVQRRRSVRSRVLSFFGGIDERGRTIRSSRRRRRRRRIRCDQLVQGTPCRRSSTRSATLPARQREAFTLRTFEGLDVAQTAEAMGCTEGSVKTHYSRAVHRLRELLEEHGEEHRQ